MTHREWDTERWGSEAPDSSGEERVWFRVPPKQYSLISGGGASAKEKGLAASPAAGEKAFCVDQRHGRALFFIVLGWRNTSLLSASPNRTVC